MDPQVFTTSEDAAKAVRKSVSITGILALVVFTYLYDQQIPQFWRPEETQALIIFIFEVTIAAVIYRIVIQRALRSLSERKVYLTDNELVIEMNSEKLQIDYEDIKTLTVFHKASGEIERLELKRKGLGRRVRLWGYHHMSTMLGSLRTRAGISNVIMK